jgi:hypothetical protein
MRYYRNREPRSREIQSSRCREYERSMPGTGARQGLNRPDRQGPEISAHSCPSRARSDSREAKYPSPAPEKPSLRTMTGSEWEAKESTVTIRIQATKLFSPARVTSCDRVHDSSFGSNRHPERHPRPYTLVNRMTRLAEVHTSDGITRQGTKLVQGCGHG